MMTVGRLASNSAVEATRHLEAISRMRSSSMMVPSMAWPFNVVTGTSQAVGEQWLMSARVINQKCPVLQEAVVSDCRQE
jgi:hypothetical protein